MLSVAIKPFKLSVVILNVVASFFARPSMQGKSRKGLHLDRLATMRLG